METYSSSYQRQTQQPAMASELSFLQYQAALQKFIVAYERIRNTSQGNTLYGNEIYRCFNNDSNKIQYEDERNSVAKVGASNKGSQLLR